MASRVSQERGENFRFGGRQFQCLCFSDCFVKAGFIAVAQLFCPSICFGFKESPKVIYGISPPRKVFDKVLLKLPDNRLEKGRLTLDSARVQILSHWQLLVIVLL